MFSELARNIKKLYKDWSEMFSELTRNIKISYIKKCHIHVFHILYFIYVLMSMFSSFDVLLLILFFYRLFELLFINLKS